MLTSSGGSLNADRGERVKFAKILLTSYVNAPYVRYAFARARTQPSARDDRVSCIQCISE